MVAIPRKEDVVKLVKVGGQVPKGTMDLIEEQLKIKNKREGNTADLEFCLPYVLKAWADEMKAENEREARKGSGKPDRAEVEAEQPKSWSPHVAA
jgi:hypothetical protein